MKRAILACSILLIIWTLSYISIKKVGNDFEQAKQILEIGKTMIVADNYQNAAVEFNKSLELWNKDSLMLSMLLRHNEYSEIETGLARICEYAAAKSKKDVMAEVAAMRILLEDCFQNQLISLKSIL